MKKYKSVVTEQPRDGAYGTGNSVDGVVMAVCRARGMPGRSGRHFTNCIHV